MTNHASARSAARLAAVQALYQHHMEKTGKAVLLNEFHMHRLGANIDGDHYIDADKDLFDQIVAGVIDRREEIDGVISAKLTESWSIGRLDRTLLQILRAGAWELTARDDTATGVIINEYIDIAHAFFNAREAKFANGVLDAIAKAVR